MWLLYRIARLSILPSLFRCGAPRRQLSTTLIGKDEVRSMKNDYTHLNQDVEVELATQAAYVNPQGVFVNNEVDLSNINIYGFDYDHTLAIYTEALNHFIFNEARNWLVKQMKYPEELLELKYSPEFAIRGLHCDTKRGYLMKVDAFHSIQLDTVHRGLSQVSASEVLTAYKGTYLPSTFLKFNTMPGIAFKSAQGSKWPAMFQLMDFFTLPEVHLLCSVIEHFDRKGLDFQPTHIYHDVSSSVARIHKSGQLGSCIMASPETYIQKDPELRNFLIRLVDNGKRLFVISNSSAQFINRGLKYIIGDDWHDIFDVIISNARKPTFFQNDSGNQFRLTDSSGAYKEWKGVESLQRGNMYEGGSLGQLIHLTKWNAPNVLYFGDHVYSDLADVANTLGWTTAAVIPELEYEIKVDNGVRLRRCRTRLRKLELLFYRYQHVRAREAQELLATWHVERSQLRQESKEVFNPRFGSIFRTFHNPSYFSRRLTQYAIMYTSRVTNLLRYPNDHIFYPKRSKLSHEA